MQNACFTNHHYRERIFRNVLEVIVTVGWDRTLRVYDEVPREGDPPLLRQVEGAHSSDINVVAVSHRLSLIATGSAGGSCKVWDFQLLSCEGTYSAGNDVLCVCFLEPFPLVAVGDAGGYVSIVPVRPWEDVDGGLRSSAVLRFANDQQAEGTIEGPAAVTCLTHTARSVDRAGDPATGVDGAYDADGGRVSGSSGGGGLRGMIIYTGDDNGAVRAWEVGDFLASVLGEREVRENDLPRSRRNYDPRRRFNKQVCGAIDSLSGSRELIQGERCFSSSGRTRFETLRLARVAPTSLTLRMGWRKSDMIHGINALFPVAIFP